MDKPIRKKLHEAQIKAVQLMDKIGSANGTTPPDSQDPLDAALHEMAISKTLSTVAGKRYDAAKDIVMRTVGKTALDKVDVLESKVLKSEASLKEHVAGGKFYDLNVEVRLAGSKLDEKKMRVWLLSNGMTTDQVDQMYNDCKVVNTPRRYFDVVDRGEE